MLELGILIESDDTTNKQTNIVLYDRDFEIIKIKHCNIKYEENIKGIKEENEYLKRKIEKLESDE